MALEGVAHPFEERLAQAWRSSDFPSLKDLAGWLASRRLDGPHGEGQADVGVYQHEGYRTVSCRVCQRPTILGALSSDDNCGRPACDPDL